MENINTNNGTSTPFGVIVTRAGQRVPDRISDEILTTSSISGTIIPTRDSPQNLITTLDGLVSRRSTSAGLAYIYIEGDVYIFPSILSTPTLSVSLTPQTTPVTIINEFRGSIRPSISGFVRVTPVGQLQNQYYASVESLRSSFRIIVERIRPTVVINSANMMVAYTRNINFDGRSSQRAYDECEKHTSIPATTIVVYNFVEPTGASISVEPGIGVTLIGSGEVSPANSVVFSVSSDGLQLRRISVTPLLKAVHKSQCGSRPYTH